MKKMMNRFFGVVGVLALCVTLLPTQTARAEENSKATSGTSTNIVTSILTNVDETSMTEDQLLEAYLGMWDYGCYEITKDAFIVYYTNEDTGLMEENTSIVWKYEGSVIKENVPLSDEDYRIMWETDQLPTNKAKALHFSNDTFDYYLYKGHDMDWGTKSLMVEAVNKESGKSNVLASLIFKGEEEIRINDVLYAVLNNLEQKPSESIPSTEETTGTQTIDFPKLIPQLMAGLSVAITDVESGMTEENAPYVAIYYEDGSVETHTLIWDNTNQEYVICYYVFYNDGSDLGGDYPVSEMSTELPKVGDIPYTTQEVPTENLPVETPEEEPVTTTESPAETADNKEVIEKTKDGRAVYAGEQVYVVQKGDCLWTIAKNYLGNGKLYTELFVRNGDILEKAELIHAGQEIIIPVK